MWYGDYPDGGVWNDYFDPTITWTVEVSCPQCGYGQMPLNYCPNCGHKWAKQEPFTVGSFYTEPSFGDDGGTADAKPRRCQYCGGPEHGSEGCPSYVPWFSPTVKEIK